MRLLLDTHAFLWWVSDSPRMPKAPRGLVADNANEVLVSAAIAWEIATKERLGKLPEFVGISQAFLRLMTDHDFKQLGVTAAHALVAGGFQQAHRDPFDRMLSAQAHLEGIPILSADTALHSFPVQIIWD